MDTNPSSTGANDEAARSVKEEIAAPQAELDDHDGELRDEIRQHAQAELEKLRSRYNPLRFG